MPNSVTRTCHGRSRPSGPSADWQSRVCLPSRASTLFLIRMAGWQRCKFFDQPGRCRYGQGCKFLHQSGNERGARGGSRDNATKDTRQDDMPPQGVRIFTDNATPGRNESLQTSSLAAFLVG